MLENHDRLTSKQLLAILENVGSEYLGICLDPANSLRIPETLDSIISNLLPHIYCLHLKDYDIKRLPHLNSLIIEGTPVGDGKLNFASLTETVLAGGDNPSLILEHWIPYMGDLPTTLELELNG